MTAHLTNRLANFRALLLALLILSAVSAARADSDDGIVRVKSAVPMAEAITRIKADIASKGIKFFMDKGQLYSTSGMLDPTGNFYLP